MLLLVAYRKSGPQVYFSVGGYECGMWESYVTYVYAGFSLSVCFFLGASSLLECVLYVSLLLYVGVWHSVPSAVPVAFLFFPANQVIFRCTSVYCVCRQSTCYCSTRYVSPLCMFCVQCYCLLRFQ